jgi:hypothetical protein
MGSAIKHEGGITSPKTMRKRMTRWTRVVGEGEAHREVGRRITVTMMRKRRRIGDQRRSRRPQSGLVRGSSQSLLFRVTRMTTIERLGNLETIRQVRGSHYARISDVKVITWSGSLLYKRTMVKYEEVIVVPALLGNHSNITGPASDTTVPTSKTADEAKILDRLIASLVNGESTAAPGVAAPFGLAPGCSGMPWAFAGLGIAMPGPVAIGAPLGRLVPDVDDHGPAGEAAAPGA